MAVDRDIFVDVFGDVVDTMRSTGTVSDSIESGGVYTLTSANSFNARESIVINDVNYLIISATSSEFVIEASTGLDFTGETWKALAPYYMYGHPREIANRLNLKNRSAVDKFRNWPLIYLRTDIEQNHGQYKNILYEIPSFTVYIINPTTSTYTTPERIENIYKTILYPLYNTLLVKFESYRGIAKNSIGVNHSHFDRYGWGNETVYGSEGLIFNQYLDAIELTFNDTQIYRSNDTCQ